MKKLLIILPLVLLAVFLFYWFFLHPSQNCTIKGNINIEGEKIYHLPNQMYYNATKIDTSSGEKWFCTEDEAKEAGWRKAKI